MRFKKRLDDSAAAVLRPTLYGDVPIDQWPPPESTDGDPWATFAAARHAWHNGNSALAVRLWTDIAANPSLEPRHNLQAWHFLRIAGVQPPPETASDVFGVVAEVAVGKGHDVLAAYSDGTARYLNHAGGAAIVDNPQLAGLADAVESWLGIGRCLAQNVGVWDARALPPLPAGHTRVLVLTPGGFRFGQGPDLQLRQDPAAAAFLESATTVLLVVTAAAAN